MYLHENVMQVRAQPPTVLTSVLPPEGEFWVIPEKMRQKNTYERNELCLTSLCPSQITRSVFEPCYSFLQITVPVTPGTAGLPQSHSQHVL